MATKRVAGTCKVRADSIKLDLGGTVTVSPLSVMREGVSGLGGPVGYKETPRIPFIEVEVITSSSFSLEAVGAITDATVQADLANNKSYILRQAWLAGEPDINAAEGTTTLRFEGVSCDEVAS